MNYDQKAREDYKLNPKSIYYWLLASSFLYYNQPDSTPLLGDECFDRMCKHLLANFDKIPKHSKLSHLITESHLQAGSFYDILANDYPVWLVRMAQQMSNELN